MISETDFDQVREDIADLIGYLPRLRASMYQPGPEDRSNGPTHRVKVSGSPAPWEPLAATVYTEIHSGARQLERALSITLGTTVIERGGSDAATRSALIRVGDLIWRSVETQAGAVRKLAGWARSARSVLDEARPGEERPIRAPGGLRCPSCAAPVLLMPGAMSEPNPPVYCPLCLDSDGLALSWPWEEWSDAAYDLTSLENRLTVPSAEPCPPPASPAQDKDPRALPR